MSTMASMVCIVIVGAINGFRARIQDRLRARCARRGDGRRSLNQQMLPGYCVAVGAATSGGACPVAKSVIAAASCESAQLACPGGG